MEVRWDGVVCRFKTAPEDFAGFGVFQPISYTEAILTREATLAERQRYLRLFPRVLLIATHRDRGRWLGTVANRGDQRFSCVELIPIHMTQNVDLFEVLQCRFDGQAYWFECRSPRVNPRFAVELRRAICEEKDPGSVRMPGLTAEHRAAYALHHQLMTVAADESNDIQADKTPDPSDAAILGDHTGRVRDSLSHAGAQLTGLREQHGYLQVSFQVDGRSFTSAVNRDNFGLVSAGVCLDGYDHEFDLTSLVGVLREGIRAQEF